MSIKDKTIIDYENQINKINQTQKQAEESFNNVSMIKAKDNEIKNKQEEINELIVKLNKANSNIEKLTFELNTLKNLQLVILKKKFKKMLKEKKSKKM